MIGDNVDSDTHTHVQIPTGEDYLLECYNYLNLASDPSFDRYLEPLLLSTHERSARGEVPIKKRDNQFRMSHDDTAKSFFATLFSLRLIQIDGD